MIWKLKKKNKFRYAGEIKKLESQLNDLHKKELNEKIKQENEEKLRKEKEERDLQVPIPPPEMISSEVVKSSDAVKPSEVKRPFLQDHSLVNRVKRTVLHKELPLKDKLVEPILLLMKNDGYTEIIEGVKPGAFIINTPDGQAKQINLEPRKQTSIKYFEQYWRGWIAYEDSASPYPEDPLHNSGLLYRIIQKVSMNYRDTGQVAMMKERRLLWLYVLAGVGLLILVLYSVGAFDALSAVGQTAVPVAKSAVVGVNQTVVETVRL